MVPSVRGLSFGGGCAAGRCALFNMCVHSWKCVGKNCFSYLPKDMPVSELQVLFWNGRLGASVTAPLGSTGAQLCSFLACMPPLSPSSCPMFCSTPVLAGYRGLSLQPGLKVFRLKPGGSASLPSQALLCYVRPNAWLACASGLMLTLSCALAPTDSRSGGFQWSSVCRAPMRTLLFAVKGRQCMADLLCYQWLY